MNEEFSRTERLLGEEALLRLKEARVAVFGLGGVGGHAAEAIVRCAVGAIDLIDGDRVSITNINRQMCALHSTVGKMKTDVLGERFLDINPDLKIKKFPIFFGEQTAGEFDFENYDYVIDAVDDVKAKLLLAVKCDEKNVRLISSMGAAGKLDPTRFRVCDIYKTTVCPLARVMRRELKNLGIKRLKTVFSDEIPVKKESPPPSVSFVPSAAGLVIASEVIKDLISEQ